MRGILLLLLSVTGVNNHAVTLFADVIAQLRGPVVRSLDNNTPPVSVCLSRLKGA